jgi:hypothetical protein
MNRRSITIAAVLTAIAAGCAGAAAQGSKTEQRHKDDRGSELVLSRDAQGQVSARAFDPQGKPLEIKKIKLQNAALVCLPASVSSGTSEESDAAKRDCQVLNFISDLAFIKIGTDSCTCGVCAGYGYCYGDTCH